MADTRQSARQRSRNSLVFGRCFVWCTSTMKLVTRERASIVTRITSGSSLLSYSRFDNRVTRHGRVLSKKTINTAARFLAFLITFSLIDTSPCTSGSLCPHSPSSYPVLHTNCFLRIGSFTPSLSSFLPLYVPLFLCVYHSLSLCLSLFLSFIFFHSHFCPCLFRR